MRASSVVNCLVHAGVKIFTPQRYIDGPLADQKVPA